MANSLFLEGLIENDRGKLLAAPKSDLHNHSTKGCSLAWVEERTGHSFPMPPARFDGLEGMQKWFTSTVKPFCTGCEGIVMRWEGAFAEAGRNNITRLAMNFGAEEIELAGGMADFRELIEGFHTRYCPDTVFEPELTYISKCDIDAAADSMDEYLQTGYFKSIDVCGGENVRPFEDFLPLYRKAERYRLIKRMHVGESGTADDVRRAVELLELDEVHHGIGAAGSKDTMRFLADNHIRLNVCPSSNVMLGYAGDYKDHPIRTLVDNGVEVTINTDDLLIFNSSIENEYLLLYRAETLTAEQLEEIRLRGLSPGPGKDDKHEE
ncbi:MAG: adenosine deaminase [Clostridiales bacterium]|nr:adenosine deaminase [Clostridiales bacterium]